MRKLIAFAMASLTLAACDKASSNEYCQRDSQGKTVCVEKENIKCKKKQNLLNRKAFSVECEAFGIQTDLANKKEHWASSKKIICYYSSNWRDMQGYPSTIHKNNEYEDSITCKAARALGAIGKVLSVIYPEAYNTRTQVLSCNAGWEFTLFINQNSQTMFFINEDGGARKWKTGEISKGKIVSMQNSQISINENHIEYIQIMRPLEPEKFRVSLFTDTYSIDLERLNGTVTTTKTARVNFTDKNRILRNKDESWSEVTPIKCQLAA